MDNLMAFVKQQNENQKEISITFTHVLAHAIAWGMYKQRRDIGRITLGAFRRSKKLGVTVLVDVEGGTDLVPVTVWDAHKMTLIELAKYM
jgi:hypothetical protein